MSKEVNKTRLIEAAIYAVVSSLFIAAGGYYIAFPVLQKQVENIAIKQDEQYKQMMEVLREYKREREVISLKRDAQYYDQEKKIVELQIKLARVR